MTDTLKVTIIPEDEPIGIKVIEEEDIKVNLYPVTVAHPSIFDAANRAEGSAENANIAAEQAAISAQQALDAVENIGETVEAAVSEALEEARPLFNQDSIINALIFG